MTDLTSRLLPGTAALLGVQQREFPQEDGLCGAFWARSTLLAFGHEAPSQAAVAARAGITRPPPGHDAPRPPGEPGSGSSGVALPFASTPAAAGAAPSGVARAIGELSDGRVAAVPVSGQWEPGRLRELLAALANAEGDVVCLANLATSELWGSHPSPTAVLGYLLGGDPGGGPPAEWEVGHFAALVGLVTGPTGTLVVVADSYRSLGHDGVHLQPVERLASAIGGGGGGGVVSRGLLVLTSSGAQDRMRRVVGELALDCRLWDNGSTDSHAIGLALGP